MTRRMGLGIFALLVIVASASSQSATAQSAEPAICGEGGKRATLSIAPGESTTLPFGRSRDAEPLQIQLNASGCEFRPDVGLQPRHRQFRRGGASIPDEQVKVSAVTAERFLLVFLEINTKDVDPGEYKANIDILNDARVEPFSFQASTTLQYDKWYLLVLAMVPVIGLGTFLIWAQSSGSLLPDGARSLGRFLVAIGGAGSAWLLTYWSDPQWGSDGKQWLTLAGVVIAAYMGGYTGAAGFGGAKQKVGS